MRTVDLQLTSPFVGPVLGRNPGVDEILTTFGDVDERVLMTGDLFYFRPPPALMPGGDIPFVRSPGCPNALAVVPHEAITEAGERYTREVLGGEPFVAMHMRRGDFADYCKSFVGGCYFSLFQLVKCLLKKRKAFPTITKLFLATNARRNEVGKFKKLLNMRSKPHQLTIHRLPLRLIHSGAWSKPITRAKLRYAGIVFAVLDKVICARATVFLGSPHSTFSTDIQRMSFELSVVTHCTVRD